MNELQYARHSRPQCFEGWGGLAQSYSPRHHGRSRARFDAQPAHVLEKERYRLHCIGNSSIEVRQKGVRIAQLRPVERFVTRRPRGLGQGLHADQLADGEVFVTEYALVFGSEISEVQLHLGRLWQNLLCFRARLCQIANVRLESHDRYRGAL